jgi:hypothetical protein
MVAFVEMARDKRSYRFFQDTLHGRVLIAESPKIETIVAACTNYVARRLVERERALATEIAHGEEEAEPGRAGQRSPFAGSVRAEVAATSAERRAPPRTLAPPERDQALPRTLGKVLADVVGFLLMTLGAVTLIGVLALAGYLAWTHRLGEVWAHGLRALAF